MTKRPSIDAWALGVAKAVSTRGECTRRQVGAIILDSTGRQCGSGYNGVRAGQPSCLTGACPRGRHYKIKDTMHWREPCEDKCHDDCSGCGLQWCDYSEDCPNPVCFECETEWPCEIASGVCACGVAWPCPDAVQPGSSYDTGPGACIAAHAEANCLLDADPLRRRGGTMYISEPPCDGCKKLIAVAGIIRVVAPDYEWIIDG